MPMSTTSASSERRTSTRPATIADTVRPANRPSVTIVRPTHLSANQASSSPESGAAQAPAGAGQAPQARERPHVVGGPAAEDAAVAGPALENAGPAARVPLLDQIRHTVLREVQLAPFPLVVEVEAGNVGTLPVHQ